MVEEVLWSQQLNNRHVRLVLFGQIKRVSFMDRTLLLAAAAALIHGIYSLNPQYAWSHPQ